MKRALAKIQGWAKQGLTAGQLVTVGVALLSNACSAAPEAGEEAPAAVEQEIFSGSTVSTNYFNVFIFVQTAADGWGWCSGSILGTSGGYAYVATAYHCVEATPEPGDPQYFRLTTQVNPGTPVTPPASWVTPIAAYFPAGAATSTSKDLAILVVPDTSSFRSGLTAGSPTRRLGLYFGNPKEHIGLDMKLYGYGCTTETSTPDGSGRLRSAAGLVITDQSGSNYMNWDSLIGGSGSRGACGGDSGGPDTRTFTYQDSGGGSHSWPVLLGVLSSSVWDVGFDVASPRVPAFVQTTTGRLFLSNFMNPTGFLHAASNSVGAKLTATSTSSTSALNMWYYDSAAQRLMNISGLCLQGPSTTGAVSLQTCNSASTYQRWIHTGDLQLKNVGSSRCATYEDGAINNRTCSASAEQAWVFRGDPL